MSGEHYVLEPVGGSHLLLDLRSGDIRLLNESAAIIWTRSLEGASDEEIAAGLCARWGVDHKRALRDVKAALGHVNTPLAAPEVRGPYAHQVVGREYSLAFEGVPVLSFERGTMVRRIGAGPGPEMKSAVAQMVPRLLFAAGITVLHASCVVGARGLRVFSGWSRAGKTTLARTLCEVGETLVSLDKVIIRRVGGHVAAVLEGEARIASLVNDLTSALSEASEASWPDLRGWDDCEAVPISRGYFVSSARRVAADEFGAQAVAPAAALRELLSQTYVGTASAIDWRTHARVLATLTTAASWFDLTCPLGLERLQRVIRLGRAL